MNGHAKLSRLLLRPVQRCVPRAVALFLAASLIAVCLWPAQSEAAEIPGAPDERGTFWLDFGIGAPQLATAAAGIEIVPRILLFQFRFGFLASLGFGQYDSEGDSKLDGIDTEMTGTAGFSVQVGIPFNDRDGLAMEAGAMIIPGLGGGSCGGDPRECPGKGAWWSGELLLGYHGVYDGFDLLVLGGIVYQDWERGDDVDPTRWPDWVLYPSLHLRMGWAL